MKQSYIPTTRAPNVWVILTQTVLIFCLFGGALIAALAYFGVLFQ